jgi:hypothetical protein
VTEWTKTLVVSTPLAEPIKAIDNQACSPDY